MAIVKLAKRGLHAKELDMRFLDDVDQRHHVEKFLAHGYVKDPAMVCMYNPETREQLYIFLEDQHMLESRGFFATPAWVYHPTEAPKGKIVSKVEADRLCNGEGWYDTPAKFPGNYMGIAKPKIALPKGHAA